MPRVRLPKIAASIIFSLSLLLCSVNPAYSQETAQETPQEDEIIRISTELVQVDVMVFDKQGNFVNDLKADQFEVRLEGRPQPVSFFERLTSGSRREEAQLSTPRDRVTRPPSQGTGTDDTSRGRAIFFFVNDFHLSRDSVARTRKLLQHYVDEEMADGDQAVIVTSSGQIGFLQQLTDNKTVLREAIQQINARARSSKLENLERWPISEYEALAISHNDQNVISYFADLLIKETPGLDRQVAEETVRSRARQIIEQAAVTVGGTLAALEKLIRSSAEWPGRKLVFFMSDGLQLDTSTSNTAQRLDALTDAAARSGVVVYTIDIRGLITGQPDASSNTTSDLTGRLSRVRGGEASASQDMFYTLAENTGGRALVNRNDLGDRMTKVLSETSAYYLLAWKPDRPVDSANKFQRLEISVKGRPELTVRSRRGFYSSPNQVAAPKPVKTQGKVSTDSPAEAELRVALGSLYPRTALPMSLSLGYVNTAGEGTSLTATIQVSADDSAAAAGEAQPATKVDVVCVVFDSKGKSVSSIKSQVSFNATTPGERPSLRRAQYTRQFKLPPGLYQVRIAARDSHSGRTGSFRQWIQIPDIAGGNIALGSLLVSEQRASQEQGGVSAAETALVGPDHIFERTSKLRFGTVIYNAASAPDLNLEVKFLRDQNPIVTVPLKQVESKGVTDVTRIPYAAELALDGLVPGRYVLQLALSNRKTKQIVEQEFKFAVR